MKHFENIPLEILYGTLAIMGGVSRYLSRYSDGTPFSKAKFAASTFVSGFSGYMFALVGISMSLPQPFIFMMAGTGGFMGEQTMKLVLEYIQGKAK